MRRPHSRSSPPPSAARPATRRWRASRSPRSTRTITGSPARSSSGEDGPPGSGMSGCSDGHTPSNGCGSSGSTGTAARARASVSSHAASCSRASRQPPSAFSPAIRAASASAARRSRTGSRARSSALPDSRIRCASRTELFRSLICWSQARAAASVSSGPPAISLARRNVGVQPLLGGRDVAGVGRQLGLVDALAQHVVLALRLAQGVGGAAGLVAGGVRERAPLVDEPAHAGARVRGGARLRGAGRPAVAGPGAARRGDRTEHGPRVDPDRDRASPAGRAASIAVVGGRGRTSVVNGSGLAGGGAPFPVAPPSRPRAARRTRRRSRGAAPAAPRAPRRRRRSRRRRPARRPARRASGSAARRRGAGSRAPTTGTATADRGDPDRPGWNARSARRRAPGRRRAGWRHPARRRPASVPGMSSGPSSRASADGRAGEGTVEPGAVRRRQGGAAAVRDRVRGDRETDLPAGDGSSVHRLDDGRPDGGAEHDAEGQERDLGRAHAMLPCRPGYAAPRLGPA